MNADLVRGRRATRAPIPTDYERLEQLHAIQTVLAQPDDLEHVCDETLSIMTRILAIRTAVVLDKARDVERALMWVASGLAATDLDEARDRARRTLGYLHADGSQSTFVDRTAVLPAAVRRAEAPSRSRSRWRRRAWHAFPWRTRDVESRRTVSRSCSIATGKRTRPRILGQGSGSRSPRGSSWRTAGPFPSPARSGAGRSSRSRSRSRADGAQTIRP